MEKCFYETYLIGDMVDTGELTIDTITEKFMSVANVLNVMIEDVPTL